MSMYPKIVCVRGREGREVFPPMKTGPCDEDVCHLLPPRKHTPHNLSGAVDVHLLHYWERQRPFPPAPTILPIPQIPPAAATLEGAQPDRLPNHRVTPQPARGTCRRGHCQAAAVLGAGGCGLGPGEVFWAQGGDTGKPVPRGVRMASHRRGHHSGWKMKWEPNAERREFDSWPPSGHPGPGTGLAPNSGTTRTVGPRARLPGRGGAHGSLQGFLDTTALPAWSELSGSMAVN